MAREGVGQSYAANLEEARSLLRGKVDGCIKDARRYEQWGYVSRGPRSGRRTRSRHGC
jgi:hypothetical protein